ncbi:16S rRNA (cytosine(1402)-N(4))-methyltransferase RsmH [Candidatus Poribacteria bacterium]|nr:16S rRNA (cytosine(1402)-N(4))-methyltransferase RsmH [Candidatus Poribacteria bacterium]MYG09137.1 16S rRNA (cytosine(1402)-N(4))-methyltransferase RsmH [Candidatus Poribacteria bacterium]MYK21745.1 16S rRNA (cytosine(1402)-N(4))-methyltransferase RsmH [Candidatus Poribacteria bacterium]
MDTHHIPVLCDKVVNFLNPKPEGVYIDGTVGLGGHSAAILELSAPSGHLIGIDLDVEALTVAENRLHTFGERSSLINGNFAEMDVLLARHSVHAVDGILLDLGVSSLQLDTPHRGFSFNHTGPLDMRMNLERGLDSTKQATLTAMQVVNGSTMDVLVDIFRRYGEERFAKRIAERVVRARQQEPITTTTQFAEIVKKAVPQKASKIHPATRVFQALRIHVNAELENLRSGLDVAISLLKPGGCLCVITFHSLEDRIVKRCFQTCARPCICPPKTPICICEHEPSVEIVTKRPVSPGGDEIQHNPRARSAKLRVARKL